MRPFCKVRFARQASFHSIAAGMILMCGGCLTSGATSRSSWTDKLPGFGNKDETPKAYPNPVKMAATWTPDTLVKPGHTPTRGFGGRLYFYDERTRPVPVEGSLIVHGFDDTGSGGPTVRKFQFTPEQFTRHFSESDLGASYSVWIPWDAVGGFQRRISLVASFQTAEGKLVQGQPATVLLPGPQEGSEALATAKKYSAQYLAHREAMDRNVTSRGMSTTTIARRSAPRRTETQTVLPELPPAAGSGLQMADLVPARDVSPDAPTGMRVQPASARLR